MAGIRDRGRIYLEELSDCWCIYWSGEVGDEVNAMPKANPLLFILFG